MLEKLRAKPEHVKRNIALALTTIIFSGIVFVWWSSFEARLHTRESQEKALSPLAGFKELFQGISSDVRSGMAGVPSYIDVKNGGATTTTIASSTKRAFDISEVTVIDDTATTTKK